MDLWSAVKTRAEADTAAGGLFGTGAARIMGIFNQAHPEEMDQPFVIFDPESSTSEDAFNTLAEDTFFRFHVWVARPGYVPEPATDPDTTAWAIIMRLWGDWHRQAATTPPTYGFDRWQPTLTAPWVGGTMIRRGWRAEHESDALHYVLPFRMHPAIPRA